MRERRNLERFDLSLPAKIEVVAKGEEKVKVPARLLTKNICAKGAYFYTDQPLPEGTEVKIRLFHAPDKLIRLGGNRAFIRVNGRVVRAEPAGMAVCFYEDHRIIPLYEA
jgi:hypothetical protein